ncbi:hypothetical protein P170DRAFT_33190 [Aspergillus steynii IBT 23096]|uniref:Uncharacterized protein n=1 Tax=Aspergillus steynii IBT 23096 TaxID=1392250 RepID=A0A2I2GQJ8_9EURO|nr:uncharacterized protein P170DRAFT_33190 [Aspergillus steynii IBT 23096]PLB55141.1 hypothetical protein P170DRAFT_33190 [Aspergillus steynii IBT 23096]
MTPALRLVTVSIPSLSCISAGSRPLSVPLIRTDTSGRPLIPYFSLVSPLSFPPLHLPLPAFLSRFPPLYPPSYIILILPYPSRTVNILLLFWVLHIHRITSVQPLRIRESTRLDRSCAVGHHFPAWLISTLRLGPNIVFALSSLHLSLHPTSIINPLFLRGDPTPPASPPSTLVIRLPLRVFLFILID